jgi:hypothetical protein
MPQNGNPHPRQCSLCPNGVAWGEEGTMSRRQRSASTSPRQRHSSFPPSTSQLLSPGYEQYQRSLLEVPWPADYGEASSDDLSSEWDSDAPDVPPTAPTKVVHLFYLALLNVAMGRDFSPRLLHPHM